jgi:(S)-2-hydroxyglutarate dehydrogenase
MIPTASDPSGECDLAVIGGGILGLAVARELKRRDPDQKLVLLEKEDSLATHQTGHSSGVAHAGIYYEPGSLKARLCVAGVRELYEYCAEKEIPVERCGKLIVAVDESEFGRLDELERRGRANGVPGLQRIEGNRIPEFEPHARGAAALHSPFTGIVDFAAVARAYGQDVTAGGGVVAPGCEVTGISQGAGRILLAHRKGELRARQAVFCAGLWSDVLAQVAGAPADPRIVPFRGGYLRLRPERRALVRSLIYPVPDPALPFLGIHLTRHIGGDVLVGPTALLAPARTAYRLRDVRARDLARTLAWPGTWRLARRWWRTGLTELRYAGSKRSFVRAAARYVPALGVADVTSGFAGIRAQALARDGRLVDDFVFSHTERALHVRNAPSPGATSSLAIARVIADRVQDGFGPGNL